MSNFVYIFTNVLLPILLQIFIGFFVQKKLALNIKTLSRVQIYVFIPALIFTKIYTSVLSGDLIYKIFGFTTLLFFVLMLISYVLSRLFKIPRKKEKVFMNSIILRNQGNFGIPLITLLYVSSDGDFALSIHMIVLLATNLLLNTIGIYNASSGSYTGKEVFLKILRLPILYVILLGFIFRGFMIPLWSPVMSTLEIMGVGVVPLALFTLGAQLSETKLGLGDVSVYLSSFMRLLVSPLIAWFMVLLFGIEGIMAQVLIIGAAAPTAINSVLLAIEFDGDADYASQTVFVSTLLSTLTVTFVISLVLTYIK